LASATERSASRLGPDLPLIEAKSYVVRLPPRAHARVHRLERLEPYEGKLSRTVLRGARAGNRLRLPGKPVTAEGKSRNAESKDPLWGLMMEETLLRALQKTAKTMGFELVATQTVPSGVS
jgi:hypothetical protein